MKIECFIPGSLRLWDVQSWWSIAHLFCPAGMINGILNIIGYGPSSYFVLCRCCCIFLKFPNFYLKMRYIARLVGRSSVFHAPCIVCLSEKALQALHSLFIGGKVMYHSSSQFFFFFCIFLHILVFNGILHCSQICR